MAKRRVRSLKYFKQAADELLRAQQQQGDPALFVLIPTSRYYVREACVALANKPLKDAMNRRVT